MISRLTKLPLKTLSVFVFVAFSNPVLHQVQKAHLRQYQKLHKNTVNYSAVCKASANQVDTEHLQINLCHTKSRKVGPGGGVTIYIYIYIYMYVYIYIHIYIYIYLLPFQRQPRSLFISWSPKRPRRCTHPAWPPFGFACTDSFVKIVLESRLAPCL